MFDGKFVLNQESKTRTESHVDISEVKHNLHLTPTETYDDLFLEECIEAAIEDAEGYTGFNFGTNEFVFKAYNFSGTLLKFQETPLIEITSIKVSTDGTIFTTIPTTDYNIDKSNVSFTIYFNIAVDYPYMEIEFTSGFAAGFLPSNARRAIVLKASDMYDAERGTFSAKLQNNNTYHDLLNAYFIKRW